MAYQAITSFKTAALYTLALSYHVSAALSSLNALDSNIIVNPATIEIRAQPDAPDGYSPADENCPSARPVIRTASKLSPNETSWLEQRRGKTVGPLRDLLGRINITGFDAAAYISDHAQNFSALPNIAIAVSGGGYRALLNGGERPSGIASRYTGQNADNFVINPAGVLQAFDSREENSTTRGHLGGLLQSSTYLAGLSGGGWLVGSIFVNNYTTISNLLRHPAKTSSVWEFGNSIFEGPVNNGSSLLDVSRYFDDIYQAVTDKAKAGFQTSITDYWGRALSYQLINATDGGPSYTWSSIAKEQSFATGDTPLPLLVADGRAPGETVISANSTVFEFNPWELGTFDPTIFGFAPLEFLGSNFSNGALPSGRKCVRGFDNAGYVMGTSSSLFNAFLLGIDSPAMPDIPAIAKKFVTRILQTFNQTNNDIADYSPNPFYGYHNATNLGSQSERLTLVDGGEDLQNIPLHPLIQPTRLVDVIFAVDSSADTNSSWPNGASLVATYERSRNKISNGTSFPAVPDINTFLNLGLNARPTFFGCNSSNTTSPTPLVVYIPNAPYVYLSNVSTYDPNYNNSERDAIVANGYAVATLGNGTVDSQWPTCVGCAILSRSLERTKTSVPDVCQQCFKKYCWDGTVNSTSPAPYQPKIALAAINVKSSDASQRIQISLFSGIGIAMLTIFILGL